MFVQFRILNRHHGKLFRFLDKHAPGWKLSIRPENECYQYLCDQFDYEDEWGFEQLTKRLRTYQWNTTKHNSWKADHHECITAPVIMMAPEQATICKLFWPEAYHEHASCEVYSMPCTA